MSDTNKEYKGKSYKPRKQDNKKKNKGDKKFFGNTSGTHSKSTEAQPKKGEQFVKYGWPFETRNKSVIKNGELEKEADKEIKENKK